MAEISGGTILYGMMGAGKSTLGEGLAAHIGQNLVDTDDLIEVRFGLTCADIVADPELDFAQHQRQAVSAYLPTEPEVVATGGSVAMYADLVGHLASFGVGIFIDVEAEALEARLSPERIAALNNPKNLSFAELYAERAVRYREAADYTLQVAGTESEEVTLERLIDLRGSLAT